MKWMMPRAAPTIRSGEVHLWLGLTGLSRIDDPVASGCSPEELARAARLYRAADRTLFVLAHAMLRDVLAGYLNTAASAIALRAGRHGKPELADARHADLRFNLSHSGDAVLCAVTRGREIGVDIEAVVAHEDLLSIGSHFFAEDECAALAACTDRDRVTLFYLLWTRKEAYLKAHGKGLSHPLSAFSVLASVDTRADPVVKPLTDESGSNWHCYGLPAPAGYAAGFALEGAPERVSCWQWPANTPSPASCG
jgi:4'-phosphopantetheinyl transferase